MTHNPQRRLRPIDLARPHGLSTQAVRNYEDQGVLPAAERSASGYRSYRQQHVTALAAFVALTPGCGHARAAAILRAVNRDDPDAAFALLDEAHRELAADRATLRQVRTALAGVGPTDGATPSGPDVFVGDVARSIGVVPATLRTWEREGIVTPDRDRATGYRVYSPADLRDARMAQQLRRGGYSLAHIATLTRRVREAGGVEPLRDTLDGWQASLTARGRALVSGAAALDTHLRG
ncbi:MerR family transcriptional regulator [Tsukamurella paurometabola]|uniref:Transcriptional regulator, MerR family n=1 Tax=Tsukamurella paurometabola (strain ATCC 8368 / DSM 20162 / CCUG 35730 / CIP 100753 / JCM 10117 / KCTC 9821 / NBRC 16120 / NCIMB 702349 / NCTC 13040) TaxID=521096 RepID=D5UVZ1_TSUPD|nr:MerR family transcriptional regulator [Tsukamurella paurometabola]ADG77798.1 transcriptional regulator, MerR family [Tsukamurella paurometabola DSM 20162]